MFDRPNFLPLGLQPSSLHVSMQAFYTPDDGMEKNREG